MCGEPVVVDVFDADALTAAVIAARPDVVIHQLTDLPSAPGTPGYAEAQQRNVRLRIEGTRNLMAAAKVAGGSVRSRKASRSSMRRAKEPHHETDPLDRREAAGARHREGVTALEEAVLHGAGIAGLVLRYGYLYGPGTWYEKPPKRASSACRCGGACRAARARRAARLALYNIAEDDGAVSIVKARARLASIRPSGSIHNNDKTQTQGELACPIRAGRSSLLARPGAISAPTISSAGSTW